MRWRLPVRPPAAALLEEEKLEEPTKCLTGGDGGRPLKTGNRRRSERTVVTFKEIHSDVPAVSEFVLDSAGLMISSVKHPGGFAAQLQETL